MVLLIVLHSMSIVGGLTIAAPLYIRWTHSRRELYYGPSYCTSLNVNSWGSDSSCTPLHKADP